MDDKLKIIRDNRGYVVVNENGEYKHHAHLLKYKTCKLLIRIMEKKIVPKSEYLRGSVKRLTLDENYITKVEIKQAKDREKPAYFNSDKGLR